MTLDMLTALNRLSVWCIKGMIPKMVQKMSKSKGNVVSPDEFVARWLRCFPHVSYVYGPLTDGGNWNDRGITGVARLWIAISV